MKHSTFIAALLLATSAATPALAQSFSPTRSTKPAISATPNAAVPDSATASLEDAGMTAGAAMGSTEMLAQASPGARADGGAEDRPAALKLYNVATEGGTVTPGAFQIETGFSFSHRTEDDKSFAAYSGSLLLSYGVTDRFQIGLIAGVMTATDSKELDSTDYDGSGIEFYYALNDSEQNNGVGFALYQSALLGPELLSLDSRLVVTLDRGPYNLTYNFRIGNDFGDVFASDTPHTGTLGHVLAGARTFEGFGPFHEVSAGLEINLDSSWDEWRKYEDTSSYVGPTFGVTFAENWSVSVTGLYQLSDIDDLPRWQVIAAVVYSF